MAAFEQLFVCSSHHSSRDFMILTLKMLNTTSTYTNNDSHEEKHAEMCNESLLYLRSDATTDKMETARNNKRVKMLDISRLFARSSFRLSVR